jgi:MFS family permease
MLTVRLQMPIYFQVVRGLSASKAGVMVLPIAAGLIVSVLSSGYLITLLGYYNPFMILTSLITPVASGLMTTFDVNAELWALIVFQILLGCGTGIGFQGPQVAVQAILSEKDCQLGISIIQFAQGMGPAVFIAAAQTIFQSRLVSNVNEFAEGTDMAALTQQGLTVPAEHPEYRGIVQSYNNAITEAFYLPVGLACASLVGALCIEWNSVKAKKK